MKNLNITMAMTLTALFLLTDTFWILLLSNWSLIAADEHSWSNRHLSQANLDFGLQVYQYLSKEDRNVFVSPFSLSVALAMLGAGSRGETWIKIKNALHLKTLPDQKTMNLAFASAIRSLSSDVNYTLFLANRIFVNKDIKLLPEYARTLKESFNSSPQNLDFSQKPSEVAMVINKWVNQCTNNYIKNIVTSGDIDTETALLSINAIYFKGLWENRFDARETRKTKFLLSSKTESKLVPMMAMKSNLRYSESASLDCKVIELAYVGGRMVMYVFLPNQIDGIRRLKNDLSPGAFKVILQNMKLKDVLVRVPKFRMNYKKSLKKMLVKLGAADIFGRKADLSGITESETISVTNIVHESYVSVDEKGTEAAAVSNGIANIRSGFADEPPIEFVADHPFIIIIYDTKTDFILFVGNVDEP